MCIQVEELGMAKELDLLGARITGGCEMLDVGIKLRTSERAVPALNH